MAEGVGVEPTKALRPAGFQDQWNTIIRPFPVDLAGLEPAVFSMPY